MRKAKLVGELTRREVARHFGSLQEGIAAAEACFA